MSSEHAAMGGIRSALFTPADRRDRLRKALTGAAGSVIADLEDGVAPAAKDQARAAVADAFTPSGGAWRWLRVNASQEHIDADLRVARDIAVDAIVLPKAEPALVGNLAGDGAPVVAIIETAVGLRACFEVAAHPRVRRLMLGTVDLAAELGIELGQDSRPLLHARSVVVTDSAAAGIEAPMDGVWPGLADPAGLRREAMEARALGFGSKACIHPAQLEVVHQAFTPSGDEVARARRIVSTFEHAEAAGTGAILLEGQMVDVAVVRRARDVIDRVEAAP